jgi:DUF4097 and DUF4098 domain-containing protein YvlB
MTDRIEKFQIDGRPDVFLRLPAGEARVVRGDEGSVEIRMSGRDSVLEKFVVALRGGQVVVEPETGGRIGRWSGIDVEIRVGSGASIHARLAAGDVSIGTDIESLTVEAGSGDVTAGAIAGDARVKTASGDIVAASVGGRLEVVAASGDIRVRTVAGDVNAKTASGDITFGLVAGSLSAHSASGDIEVGTFDGDSFEAKTLAGDVRLGVTAGRKFSVDFASLSGDVRTDFPVSSGGGRGTTARLAVKTMSGDIVVRPAR